MSLLADAAAPAIAPEGAAAASAGAVRKRYLHLALRLHPDKAKHPQAPEAFTAIEAAWQKLRPAA